MLTLYKEVLVDTLVEMIQEEYAVRSYGLSACNSGYSDAKVQELSLKLFLVESDTVCSSEVQLTKV